LTFKSVLEFASFADRWALLRPNELPWAAIFGPSGDSTIVIFEPLLQFCGHADVKATFGILDDIDPRHGDPSEEVAGAGFEPAIRQLPDYESDDLLFDWTMTIRRSCGGGI
jgi:hypothetical protein